MRQSSNQYLSALRAYGDSLSQNPPLGIAWEAVHPHAFNSPHTTIKQIADTYGPQLWGDLGITVVVGGVSVSISPAFLGILREDPAVFVELTRLISDPTLIVVETDDIGYDTESTDMLALKNFCNWVEIDPPQKGFYAKALTHALTNGSAYANVTQYLLMLTAQIGCLPAPQAMAEHYPSIQRSMDQQNSQTISPSLQKWLIVCATSYLRGQTKKLPPQTRN